MTEIVIETEPLEDDQAEHVPPAQASDDAIYTLKDPLINTAKDINFNLLGNIDEHMFSRNSGDMNDIGIDSSSEEESVSEDNGGDGGGDGAGMSVTGLIHNYARAKSEPDSVGSQQDEYVDLEEERNLTTPFNDKSFGAIRTNVPPVLDARDQSGGWYGLSHSLGNDKANAQAQQLDVHYLDKKLQEKFHCLTDPNLPSQFPKPLTSIKIKDIGLNWKIFGGHDFNEMPHFDPSDTYSEEHQFFSMEYDEEKIDDDRETKNKYNALHSADVSYRSNRKVDEVMQCCFDHMFISFYQFAKQENIAERLVVTIGDMEVHDMIK